MNQLLSDLQGEIAKHKKSLAALDAREYRWRLIFWADIVIFTLGFAGLALAWADINYIPGDFFISTANSLISFQSSVAKYFFIAVFGAMAALGLPMWDEVAATQRKIETCKEEIKGKEKRLVDENLRLERERAEEEKRKADEQEVQRQQHELAERQAQQQIAQEVATVFVFGGHALIKGRPDNSEDDVRKLQILLTGRGNATRIDGAFGDDTETKVKAAQTGLGVIDDGTVGEHTWHRLVEEAIASGRGRQLLDLYRQHQPQA